MTHAKLYAARKGNPCAVLDDVGEAGRMSIHDILYPHESGLPFTHTNAACWAWLCFVLPNPPSQALAWRNPAIEFLGFRLRAVRRLMGAKAWAPIQRQFVREVGL
jgi:hypothetical protein